MQLREGLYDLRFSLLQTHTLRVQGFGCGLPFLGEAVPPHLDAVSRLSRTFLYKCFILKKYALIAEMTGIPGIL